MSAKLRILKNGREVASFNLKEGEELTAGRGDTCQVVLDDEAVSRHHFKISKDESGWVLEKLSKFGALYHDEELVTTLVLQAYDTFSVPPFQFLFEVVEEDTQEIVPQSEEVELSETTNSVAVSTSDEEVDENTSTEAMRALPFLTLLNKDEEETLRLEGVSWTCGRDENCEIKIDDKRSSRRHFKIVKNSDDYFVQDLGSSNGTLLNGKALTKALVPLDSGDRITVGDTVLVFELKDPMLEQVIKNLPTTVDEANPASIVYMPIDMSASSNRGGAVRIDTQKPDAKAKRTKQIRFLLVLIALGIAGYSFIKDESEQKTMASKGDKATTSKDPYDTLGPQEQEFVKRTYNLAKNLYMQTKYELALNEIRKLHEHIPSYLDSKELESLCEAALQSIANKKYEEDVERKQKEALSKAKQIVSDCTTRFAKSSDVSGIESCLGPALEIDPENAQARQLVESAKALIEQKEVEKSNRADHQRRVKQREAIYNQAKQLQASEHYLDAIDVYERHIASNLPDPQHLEEESKRNVAAIKEKIKGNMDIAIKEAEGHLANSEYKEAIAKLEKALELEPNNKKARTVYDTASKELFKKMKGLFSDSVVEESLGNVESAKVKWKKILEQDSEKGEYRAKAQIKLKKYGE